MKLVLDTKGDVLWAHIDGELDHHFAGNIREQIDDRMKRDIRLRSVEFDFSRLSFMDSSGVAVIMGRYKLAKQRGGKVYISGVRPQIQKLLEICGLTEIVTIL